MYFGDPLSGITVEIVGIEAGTEASSNVRSCKEHDVFGPILTEDVVMRLRKVQVDNGKGMEKTAIVAYLFSDRINWCRVGFLQTLLIKHCEHYDGALVHITEVYSADSEITMK